MSTNRPRPSIASFGVRCNPWTGNASETMTKKTKTTDAGPASRPKSLWAPGARVALVRRWRVKSSHGTRVLFGDADGSGNGISASLADDEHIVSDRLVHVARNREGKWAVLGKEDFVFPWLEPPWG